MHVAQRYLARTLRPQLSLQYSTWLHPRTMRSVHTSEYRPFSLVICLIYLVYKQQQNQEKKGPRNKYAHLNQEPKSFGVRATGNPNAVKEALQVLDSVLSNVNVIAVGRATQKRQKKTRSWGSNTRRLSPCINF